MRTQIELQIILPESVKDDFIDITKIITYSEKEFRFYPAADGIAGAVGVVLAPVGALISLGSFIGSIGDFFISIGQGVLASAIYDLAIKIVKEIKECGAKKGKNYNNIDADLCVKNDKHGMKKVVRIYSDTENIENALLVTEKALKEFKRLQFAKTSIKYNYKKDDWVINARK